MAFMEMPVAFLKAVLGGKKFDPLDVHLKNLGGDKPKIRDRAAKCILRIGQRAVPTLLTSLNAILSPHESFVKTEVVRIKGTQKEFPLASLKQGDKLDEILRNPMVEVIKRDDYWSQRDIHFTVESARLLGQLGKTSPDQPDIIRMLVRSLGLSNVTIANAAKSALMGIGDAIIPAMLELLKQPDPRKRVQAAAILQQSAVQSPDLVSAMVQALDQKDENLQTAAIRILANNGPLSKDAVPKLLSLLTSKGRAALDAKQALLKIGPAGMDALAESLMNAADSQARYAIINVILGMAVEAKSALPALYQALSDQDELVRDTAAEAIYKAGPDEAGIPFLVAVLGNSHYRTAHNASMALGAIGPAAIPLVTACLKSEDWIFRQNAARTLGRMGPAAAPVVANLVEILGDPEPKVRDAAIEALGNIGPQAATALPDLLKTWEGGGKVAPMVQALGKLAQTQAVEPLFQHLFLSARSGSYSDLKDYRDALQALGKVSALTDKVIDWAVRASSYAHLFHGGEHDPGYISLNDSDEAVRCLCAVDSPITSNILHLVAGKKDISVTMSTGCSNPWQEKVDFQKQRDLALAELQKRGNPPYRPESYLSLSGNQAAALEKQVISEQKKEKERRYQQLLSLMKTAHTTERWGYIQELCRDHKRIEVVRMLANELARFRYIGPGDLSKYEALIVEASQGLGHWEVMNAIAPVQLPWPSAYSSIVGRLEKKQA